MSGNYSGIGSPFISDLLSNLDMSFYNVSSEATKTNSSGVKSAFNRQTWSAAVFKLPNAEITYDRVLIDTTETEDVSSMYISPSLDLVWDTYGGAYGIFSCNTTLSNITYFSDTSGNIGNITLTPMNDTASAPFYSALAYQVFGDLNLNQGLNLAGVSATDSEDLAYQLARVLDRTILGLSAGILPDREAESMFFAESHQVAKVPKPEFIALITLNLLLSGLSVLLAVEAYVLSRKHGVVDLQMRLGLGAMVAGMFED